MEIVDAEWLDNGEKIEIQNGRFAVEPFVYGESYSTRIAKMKRK